MESKIKNENFSIICNNCIGGFIYQYYNIEYRTPTLGLFLSSEDYIKFLSNIKFYLSKKLEFITIEQSMHRKQLEPFRKYITYPFARLYDIEVYFMHYKNEQEAMEKWYRRIKKINWDDLIIILAENEGFNYNILKQFDSLPFKNKVCFTKNKYPDIKSACYIDEMQEPGSKWSVEYIMNHFNLTEFINNRR